MKEIVSVASNIFLVPQADGCLVASAELAITTTEPEYRASGPAVAVERERKFETFRVGTTTASLYQIADDLRELAGTMEELEAKYNKGKQRRNDNYAVFMVGKNAVGEFEMWQEGHEGEGTFTSFATVAEAKDELARRLAGWKIEGPEPLENCDTGIVIFKATPPAT